MKADDGLGFRKTCLATKKLECKSWRAFADISLKAMAMKLGRWDVTYYNY